MFYVFQIRSIVFAQLLCLALLFGNSSGVTVADPNDDGDVEDVIIERVDGDVEGDDAESAEVDGVGEGDDEDGDGEDGDGEDGNDEDGGDEDVGDGEVEDGDVEDGDVEDGDVEDGDVEDGDVEDGDVEDGDVEDGDVEDGDVEDGDVEDGDVEDGDVEDGDVEDGDVEDGDVEDGDVEDGDVEDGEDEDGDVESGDGEDENVGVDSDDGEVGDGGDGDDEVLDDDPEQVDDDTANEDAADDYLFECGGARPRGIPLEYVCDGIFDCVNHSDEQNCVHDVLFGHSIIQQHQPEGMFYHPECTSLKMMGDAHWVVVSAKLEFDLPQSNGNLVLLGVDAMIEKLNFERLELGMKPICPITVNDEYEGVIATAIANHVLSNYKDHIIGYLLPVGTPTVLSMVETITENQRFVFFPYTGAVNFVNDNSFDLNYLLNTRVRYNDEVVAILKFLHEEKQVSNIVMMKQKDSFGDAVDTPLTEFTARNNPLSREGLATYIRNQFDDVQIADTIAQTERFLRAANERGGNTAVVLVGVSTAIARVIARIDGALAEGVTFVTISFAGHESLHAELEVETQGLPEEEVLMKEKNSFIVEVLPNNDDSWHSIVDDFLSNHAGEYQIPFTEYLKYSRPTFEAVFGSHIALNFIHDVTLSHGDDLLAGEIVEKIQEIIHMHHPFGSTESLFGVHFSQFFGTDDIGNYCNQITDEVGVVHVFDEFCTTDCGLFHTLNSCVTDTFDDIGLPLCDES